MAVAIVVQSQQYSVDNTPTECPRCHHKIAAIHTGAGSKTDGELIVAFGCPACGRIFLAAFSMRGGLLNLQRTEPQSPVVKSFGLLDGLSPHFVSVFNQAAAAEAHELSEIAGLAYRKALEFLLKDYCIHLHPKDAEAVKTSFLSRVIKTYFDQTLIGNAAERAAWLGNDEAHYVRVWEQHDITSLKALLNMVVNEISQRLEYERLMASFEPPAAPAAIAS